MDATRAVSVSGKPLGFVERLRVVLAAGVAVLLMTTVGWMVAQPVDPDMAVSFTTGGRNILAVWPGLLMLTVVSAMLGTVIAGQRLPEAGLFAAAVGLAALALRGHSMQTVLGYCATAEPAGRRALMWRMGLDCLLWGGLLAAAWLAMWLIWRWLWMSPGEEEVPVPQPSAKRGKGARPPIASGNPRGGWPAMVVTSVIGLFIVWLTVARTPVATIARGQVFATVAIGMYLGAMGGRYFTGVHQSHWYALAPLVVGLVGYLLGYLQADMSWAKGPLASYALLATTPPHALVRPLPIEYIAVGVAGALAGFWSGEKIEHAAGQETS